MKLMTYRQVGRQALEEHWVHKNSHKCVDRWGLEMDEYIDSNDLYIGSI